MKSILDEHDHYLFLLSAQSRYLQIIKKYEVLEMKYFALKKTNQLLKKELSKIKKINNVRKPRL